MPAHASTSPFNSSNWYMPVAETYVRDGKTVRRSTIKDGEMEWDFSTGWHYKKRREMINHALKDMGISRPKTRKCVGYAPDGTKITVYKTDGYSDYIGFHPHLTPGNYTAQEAVDFGLKALADETDVFSENCGDGHISEIKYAVKSQVMQVTFADGGICLFFRVPSAVAGELLHLAKAGTTFVDRKGVTRHVVGQRFWDLVRIRGQQYGARYPFEYQKHSDYKVTGSNKRYLVRISEDNLLGITGGAARTGLLPADGSSGQQVVTLMSPEELAEYHTYRAQQASTGDESSEMLFVKYKKQFNKDKGDLDTIETSDGGYDISEQVNEDLTGNESHSEIMRGMIDKANSMPINTKLYAAQKKYNGIIDLVKDERQKAREDKLEEVKSIYYNWLKDNPDVWAAKELLMKQNPAYTQKMAEKDVYEQISYDIPFFEDLVDKRKFMHFDPQGGGSSDGPQRKIVTPIRDEYGNIVDKVNLNSNKFNPNRTITAADVPEPLLNEFIASNRVANKDRLSLRHTSRIWTAMDIESYYADGSNSLDPMTRSLGKEFINNGLYDEALRLLQNTPKNINDLNTKYKGSVLYRNHAGPNDDFALNIKE